MVGKAATLENSAYALFEIETYDLSWLCKFFMEHTVMHRLMLHNHQVLHFCMVNSSIKNACGSYLVEERQAQNPGFSRIWLTTQCYTCNPAISSQEVVENL